MSDSPLLRSVSAGLRLTRPRGDSAIRPFAREAEREEEAKRKKFQPLQMVLDLLQRGQYLTANMADEIEESFRTGRPLGESTIEVLKAAWQGLAGTRKGDWETLLFGGTIGGTSDQAGEREGWVPQDVQEKLEKPLIRWGKEGSTGLAEGALRPSKMIGLAANILLDPTTYINPFGKATKAATRAAGDFARDTVRLTLATMGPDDFAKLGLKFSEKAGKGMGNVLKVIENSGSDIAKRFVSKTYDDAFKFALRNTPEKLMGEVAPRIATAQGRGGMDNLLKTITQESYKGAGERRLGSFFGKQFGVTDTPSAISRQFDNFKSAFEKTKVGHTLGEAWWSVMNRGPVGSIRKALGFRNPYQQMLHLDQRSREMAAHATAEIESRKLQQVFSKFDDDVIQKHKMLRMEANDKGVVVEELLGKYTSPQVLGPSRKGMYGIEVGDLEKIRDLDNKVNEITRKWFSDEEAATIANGMAWDSTERAAYFPQQVGKGQVEAGTVSRAGAAGTGAQGFRKSKAMKVGDHVENNAQMFEWLMGDQLKAAYDATSKQIPFHEYVKQWVTDKNMSETTLDLQEALTLRGIDHAKYMGRMNMISDLRQYGIPIDEASKVMPDLAKNMNTYGSPIGNVGLVQVAVPGFEGMLFDKEVADIITRAGQVVSSDDSMREFASLFGKATAWWKGWVTLSTGFHARNAISNNITGFLKFGPSWFTDGKKWEQSIVGSAYALHPEKYEDILTGVLKETTPGWRKSVLNSTVEGTPFTVRELGDYLRSKGTISSHTQVSEEIGQKIGGKIFDVSRSIGDTIENQSKFLAFLHDYTDLAKQTGQVGGDLATRLASQKQILDYANLEARKWFIDYGDLTQFEKSKLKPLIPFYTWIRKNLANQISGLTLYPGMYSLIPKARGALTDDEDFDYRILPEYMENLGYYPIGKTAAGKSIMRWANIPLEDVNKIPIRFEEGKLWKPRLELQDFLDDVVANSHPMIKSVIELATGKDLFRKRDIKGMERAPDIFQYLNNSPKVVEFLDGIMRKAGVREGLKVTTDREGKEMKIDGRVARMLENNMPVLKVLNMALTMPESLVELAAPDVDTWVEKITGKKDYYEGLNEVFSLISQWAGWKFREISQADEEESRERRLMSRAEELKAEAAKGLPGYQQRREKSLKARQIRASRLFK